MSLGSCGYSLRGSDMLSSKFETIQLSSQQPNSEFSCLLRRSLEVANVNVEAILAAGIESVATDLPVLTISPERIVNRPVSINPRARAAQYEMRVSISIALNRAEEILISPETLYVERVYFEDLENISGNQEEIKIIATEMRRELVNQLMRRLEAVPN